MLLNKNTTKRIATIQDISGFGKCSLTVALPIISACGLETCVIPTALLSTHTGGLNGYTYKDLTNEILPIARHWKSLGLHFDAIYSGFLGSYEQIEIVSEVFDMLKSDDTIILVDPCMADHGKLYSVYDDSMITGMKNLCKKADIIVPNLTEAALLLNEQYNPKINLEKIKLMIKDLSQLSCSSSIITGMSFDDKTLGAACYCKDLNHFGYYTGSKCPINYHGTGDIFASVLISSIVNGLSLDESTRLAVEFCTETIEHTFKNKKDERFGVDFEAVLPRLMQRFKTKIEIS